MIGIAYEERGRLGNIVPEIGQFSVMQQIPKNQIFEPRNMKDMDIIYANELSDHNACWADCIFN